MFLRRTLLMLLLRIALAWRPPSHLREAGDA
jgi:hypothetical protein